MSGMTKQTKYELLVWQGNNMPEVLATFDDRDFAFEVVKAIREQATFNWNLYEISIVTTKTRID